MVPWLTDMSVFKPNTYDLMFGHFDASRQFLIQSYIEEHSALNSMTEKTADSIGNFIEVVKPDGYIFSGHIHARKEFKAKGRNFIFIGTPCQLSFGEMGLKCGYYLLDSNNKPKFEEIKGTPKHFYIKMSEVSKIGVDKYNFDFVSGNIIQRVYDLDVDRKIDNAVIRKITELCPLEERPPKYTVEIENESALVSPNNFDNINQSQLEYIRNYIDSIDDKVLDEKCLDKEQLFNVMEKYYRLVENG